MTRLDLRAHGAVDSLLAAEYAKRQARRFESPQHSALAPFDDTPDSTICPKCDGNGCDECGQSGELTHYSGHPMDRSEWAAEQREGW